MPNRWNGAAFTRKKQIEEGLDITFSKVFIPYYVGKMAEYKPHNVLEVGCGTGHMALELSQYCRNFMALEPSRGMYAVAKEVLKNHSVKVLPSYVGDISSIEKYDLVYSHMCLQVIEDVENFFQSVRAFVSERGVVIFSIPHPCFYNQYKAFFDDSEYEYMGILEKQISFTITKDTVNRINGVPYHHRPISYYMNQLVECGFKILHFDEIFPSDNVQLLYGEKWNIPRYCSFVVGV